MSNEYKKIAFFENEEECEKHKDELKDVFEVVIKHDMGVPYAEDVSFADEFWTKLKNWLIVAMLIIICYWFGIIVLNMGEKGESVLSTAYQLALSYCAGMMIFYLSERVPHFIKERKIINLTINRVYSIIYSMSNISAEIRKSYEKNGYNHLNLKMETASIDIKTLRSNEPKQMILKDYICFETGEIRKKCKELLALYHSDLPLELVVLIEQAMSLYINSEDFLKVLDNDLIVVGGDDILSEYETLTKKIRDWCDKNK